jgi:thymidylate synthase|uniref:thymidylate synthase n=1 Tax=viral metagenome TaxID=1070528 RepID=A0A6C0JNS1_9ZZZZ
MYFENEIGYLNLLEYVLKNGSIIETRNGKTISSFGLFLKFTDIQKLPLLTTKKIYVKGVIEELLWFLKGSTNAKLLQDKNVHIWDGNSSREYLDNNGFSNYKEGELGPIYGWQWRTFGKKYNEKGDENGIDQIKYVITELMKDNHSRRVVLSGWNPLQLSEMALPPCHILYNFYKDNDGLSCLMTMRSSDLFLGLPFNIASTAILTTIIAKLLHLNTKSIAIALTDAHIYEEHVECINTQLKREIIDCNIKLEIDLEVPNLNSSIEEKLDWINKLEYNNFKITNYECHPALKTIMK